HIPIALVPTRLPPPCHHTPSLHDALPILLSSVGLAQLEPCDLGDCVPLVRRLEWTGQQRAFRHRLRRQSRVDARRAEKDQLCHPDRKSTRLNSSHGSISYAVFCLEKKQ